MSDSTGPAFLSFVKATSIGTVFAAAASSLLSLVNPGLPFIAVALLYVVVIWVCLKIMQTSLAYFVKREYATSTVFWYTLVSQVAGALLALALSALLFLVASLAIAVDWGFFSDSTLGQVVVGVVSLIPAALLAAYFFQVARNFVPVWRPLLAYWRPFYAGFRFRLDGTPDPGPQATDSPPRD